MFRLKIFQDKKDELISSLLEENKRLKIENNAYARQIDSIQHVQETYQEMINKITELKSEYEKRLHTLDELTSEYEKELRNITTKAAKEVNKLNRK